MRALLPAWSDWRPALRSPGADLLSGLIVALVALPLALGFGISSGLGAAAGIATAIVAAVFGGSRFRFLLELAEVSDVHVVILRMSHITALDTTGALVLEDAIGKLEHRGIAVLMSGLRADHRRRLAAIGALPVGGEGSIFAHTPEAIAHARACLPDPVKAISR
ncbi:sodium-independent anion transporter [Nocardia huaxiensis]|nr:sodium-independent anion transporter [Nocardia huaxiensis]